jgi:hypothetical protein
MDITITSSQIEGFQFLRLQLVGQQCGRPSRRLVGRNPTPPRSA